MRQIIFALAAVLPLSWGLPSDLRAGWSILVFALLAGLLLSRRARFRPSGAVWIAAAYLAAVSTAIAAFQSDDVAAHIQNGVYLVVLWGLAPPVFRWISIDRPDILRAAAAGFVVGQTLSSAVAVAQALTGQTFLGMAATFGRAPGLAGHPNILGLMGSLAVLVLVTHIGATRSARIWRATAAALNLVAVIASGSLTAILALTVGILTVAIVYRVRFVTLMWSGAALGLTAWIFVSVASADGGIRTPLERFQQITGQTEYISTAATRTQTFDAALEGIARDPLLGVGLDDASGVTTLALDGEVVTHNLPLRAWFQGGIALLIAVLLIYIHALRLVVAAVRYRTAASEAGVIAGMMVFALTSATLQQPYFWLVLIAAASSAAWKLQASSVHSGNRRLTRGPFRSSSGALLTYQR